MCDPLLFAEDMKLGWYYLYVFLEQNYNEGPVNIDIIANYINSITSVCF